MDADNDGVNDCYNDLCPGTTFWSAKQDLKPNHSDSSNMDLADTFGCDCAQILFCKPGDNDGEYQFGCSQGTINVWTSRSGWAADSDGDGLPDCLYASEVKEASEDTDGDGVADVVDTDDDNDGIADVQDSESDSAAGTAEEEGTGKPDWWCKKPPAKC